MERKDDMAFNMLTPVLKTLLIIYNSLYNSGRITNKIKNTEINFLLS